MANHKQAAKRARQNVKRAARNRSRKTRVHTAIRSFREALGAGDTAQAEGALNKATRELRRAASKGTLHKRQASRRVSRLVLRFRAAQAS